MKRMKQLLMTVVFLATALTLVNAQELKDKVIPAPSPEATPSHERSDITSAQFTCPASDAKAERSFEQFNYLK
jgi:hypothetical protein